MKLATVLSITAILSLLFGLSFTFAPATSLEMYGIVETTAAHRYAIQWFGIVLLAIAVLDWMSRHAGESDARRAIVAANLVHAVLGVVLALIGVLQGTVNEFGWVSVAIYALLGIGFLRAWVRRGADVAHAPA